MLGNVSFGTARPFCNAKQVFIPPTAARFSANHFAKANTSNIEITVSSVTLHPRRPLFVAFVRWMHSTSFVYLILSNSLHRLLIPTRPIVFRVSPQVGVGALPLLAVLVDNSDDAVVTEQHVKIEENQRTFM